MQLELKEITSEKEEKVLNLDELPQGTIFKYGGKIYLKVKSPNSLEGGVIDCFNFSEQVYSTFVRAFKLFEYQLVKKATLTFSF